MKEIIGQRIKDERTKQGIDQEDLVKKLGFGWSRQTLSDIENGKREVKVWEMAKIADAFHVEMSAFLPPKQKKKFEPFVLWRERPKDHKRIEAEFINKCKDYQLVESLTEEGHQTPIRELPKKEIRTREFSYSNADSLAEEVRDELGLGDFPASTLVKVLEEKYGIKFFFENLDGNGSAATCVDEFGTCILIGSNEVPWRQHFSIAHELFHIITWSKELFFDIQGDEELWKKNEELANAFAGGLLVPSESLTREVRNLAKNGKLSSASIVAMARQFGVSLQALLWRMARLNLIPRKAVEQSLNDTELLALDRSSKVEISQTDYSLSSRFVRIAYLAYEGGKISRGRLAKMLSVNLADLPLALAKFGFGEVSKNKISLSHS